MRFPERQKAVFLPRQNVDWDESKHPRGDDGKFGKANGGGKVKYSGKHSPVPKRSLEEVNSRFHKSPETSTTGKEIDLFDKGMSIRDIRKEMPNWAAEHGIVKNDHENEDTGWNDIIVSKAGIKEE